MEKKINIAELLKDCPQGMELNCTMWDNLYFDRVEDDLIHCYYELDNFRNATMFLKDGCYTAHKLSKCVIFPKGKTTWEGFVPPCKFKDGDIIFTHANCLEFGLGNTWISIYQENRNGGVATYVDYAENGSDYYSNIDGDKGFLCFEKDILRQRLATEEEKKRLFQAIKDNGYKWNAETKTLEKLIQPKFKVGDTITNGKISIKIGYIDNEYYYELSRNIGYKLFIKNQDEWELISDKFPNKFDITTLIPFESKVLVRDKNTDRWKSNFWGFYNIDSAMNYPYECCGTSFAQCIPYEKNEHLLGKTDDCDDFYKTWEHVSN